MPVDTRFGAASADTRWIFVGGSGGDVLLRNMLSGEERRPDLGILRPSGAALSPDGNFFAVTSYSGYAKLFETATLKEVAVLRGFLQGVHSAAFSPDGRRVATGGAGVEAVRLWDLETRQQLLMLEADGSVFDETGFSPDGNLLASRSGVGVLHIWRAPSWEQIHSLANQEQ
jgi:WD40 repeat protein